jgi:hypothetical protein
LLDEYSAAVKNYSQMIGRLVALQQTFGRISADVSTMRTRSALLRVRTANPRSLPGFTQKARWGD